MESWIQKLKYRHNSLSVIAHLPPELLGAIFKWLPSTYDGHAWHRAPWVNVSFVCHYWRQIALDCPELWSVLDIPRAEDEKSEDHVSTYMARSRDVPLSVSPRSPGVSFQAMRHVLSQLHRVQDLNFGDVWSDCDSVLRTRIIPRLTLPAPLLESLTLTPSGRGEVLKLPDRAFSGTLPRLREMMLRDCMIPATFAPLPSLKKLTLFEIHYRGGPSLHQLLSMLQGAPNIEDLELYKPFRPNEDSDEGDVQVHFPYLKSFQLYSTYAPEVLVVYSSITHPITSHVRLVIIPTDDTGRRNFSEHIEDLDSFAVLGSNITDRFTIRQFSIKVCDDSHSLTLSPLPWDPTSMSTEPGISIELPRGDDDGALFLPLCQRLDLSHLQALATGSIYLSPSSWLSIFGALPFLSTISILLRSGSELIAALGETLPDNNRADKPSFPALHTLIFQVCDFSKKSLSALEASLESRALLGAKLPLLRLIKGDIWMTGIPLQKVVERVQLFVEIVEWDRPPETVAGTLGASSGEGRLTVVDDFGLGVAGTEDDDTDSSDMGYGLFD
ncbi:hypothetical protein H0H87_012889 [Tephrocybe sp. NHM501043]|nr:hypothetical protein H0H87_012889 [Tephrocybe sp. NHM501043]